MVKLLLDTDVIIDELRLSEKDTIFKTLKAQKSKLYICSITITELWAGESITRPKGKRLVSKILKEVSIIPLANQIFKMAGEELRKDKNLYLADALVAGTALFKKLPLLTLNTRHFQHIKGLKLYTL